MSRRICLVVWVTVAAGACSAGGPAVGGPERSGTSPPHHQASAVAAAPVSSAPVSSAPVSSASAPEPGPGGASFERIHTGQPQPTLVVINAYPRGQHVLIDGAGVGTVPSGASATFDVAPGVHTVTCADSEDGQGNPSSVTEAFETGYQYRYQVRTR